MTPSRRRLPHWFETASAVAVGIVAAPFILVAAVIVIAVTVAALPDATTFVVGLVLAAVILAVIQFSNWRKKQRGR